MNWRALKNVTENLTETVNECNSNTIDFLPAAAQTHNVTVLLLPGSVSQTGWVWAEGKERKMHKETNPKLTESKHQGEADLNLTRAGPQLDAHSPATSAQV